MAYTALEYGGTIGFLLDYSSCIKQNQGRGVE